MSDDEDDDKSPLSPETENLLLQDILPGEATVVPPYRALSLESKFPSCVRLSQRPDGKGFMDVNTLSPDEHARTLITVPATSERINALRDEGNPLAQLQRLNGSLHNDLKLDSPQDYMLMEVHKADPAAGGRLALGNPQSFLLSINQDNLHDIAMEMLRKLAKDREAYAKSAPLMAHIVANAQLTEHDVDELKTLGEKRQNFEFCARLIECFDLLHPGYVQGLRNLRHPGGGGIAP